MKKIGKTVVILLLGLLFTYEIFVQPGIGIQLILGASLIFWRKELFKNNPAYGWGFGLLLIIAGILSTQMGWLMLGLTLIILLGENQEILNSIREIFGQRKNWKEHEYIAVNFSEVDGSTLKTKKQQLFGEFEEGVTNTYEWEDINFTKIAGTTVIDLGNTILPMGDNVVFLNQGFGNIKLIVPKGTSLSLNVSYVFGHVMLDMTPIELRSENIQWTTKEYASSPRRAKVVINGIVGKLEVIFI